jgi:hypothetical protein
MIEKWYCLKCDKCGEVVNYWETSSIDKAVRMEKREGCAKITKRVNGAYYIECKECANGQGRTS